jgi:hypothetical protein
MPKFESYQQFVDHFQSELGLGEGGVMRSPETGRPYIRIAKKGEAALFINVVLHGVDSKKHGKVVGVQIRFHQIGGDKNAFDPVLKYRETSNGGFRLSKIEFPICPRTGNLNPVQAWASQKVSEQLVDWVKTIALMTGSLAVPDAAILEAVELGFANKIDLSPVYLFDLNEKIEDAEEPVSESVGQDTADPDSGDGQESTDAFQ